MKAISGRTEYVDYYFGSFVSYNYYRKDHLGNNREVWNATTNQTVQRTQYYPSGLPWSEGLGTSVQNKKYNGKEFVEMHGLDEYDSEARWFYPAIMRTTSVDPLAEMYYSTSPYAWCSNNPENRIDPTGMATMGTQTLNSTYVDKTGNVLDYINDGDHTVYYVENEKAWINNKKSKNGLTIVGFEDPTKTYKKGDKYVAYFGYGQGIINPLSNDPISAFEMWLDKDTELISFETFLQLLANIGYSIPNSPYSWLTGTTIGGTALNSVEKMNAALDFLPSIVTAGLTKTRAVVKIGKKGIIEYKKLMDLVKQEVLAGEGWQKRIARNVQLQKALSDISKALRYLNIAKTSNDKIKK